jgi:hypothetical protein
MTKPSDENLRMAYQTLCSSYNAIDGIRGQLLGFLPLASSGIFVLLNENKNPSVLTDPKLSLPIGLFGFFITLGLYIFEIYGTRRCTYLIILGRHLEKQLGVEGQFHHRPEGLKPFSAASEKSDECPSGRKHKSKSSLKSILEDFRELISEPMAAGIIYPAVGAAWLYLGLQSTENLPLALVLSPVVFLLGFCASYIYTRWLQNTDGPAKHNYFDPDPKPSASPETTAY